MKTNENNENKLNQERKNSIALYNMNKINCPNGAILIVLDREFSIKIREKNTFKSISLRHKMNTERLPYTLYLNRTRTTHVKKRQMDVEKYIVYCCVKYL